MEILFPLIVKKFPFPKACLPPPKNSSFIIQRKQFTPIQCLALYNQSDHPSRERHLSSTPNKPKGLWLSPTPSWSKEVSRQSSNKEPSINIEQTVIISTTLFLSLLFDSKSNPILSPNTPHPSTYNFPPTLPANTNTNINDPSLSYKVTPQAEFVGKSAPATTGKQHYAVTLTAGSLPDQNSRAPIDVVVAMDISGSMSSNNKLNLCKKTCEILVNELAPRPHNSGHHTIESCRASQFENHIRAITGKALGATEGLFSAVTFNVIGSGNGKSTWTGVENLLAMEGVYVHNYGKALCREGRKMGHITITGTNKEKILTKY